MCVIFERYKEGWRVLPELRWCQKNGKTAFFFSLKMQKEQNAEKKTKKKKYKKPKIKLLIFSF